MHDPFINKEAKIKFKALNKINNNNTYDAILFLSKNSYFENQFKKLNKKMNRFKIVDPFEYYV